MKLNQYTKLLIVTATAACSFLAASAVVADSEHHEDRNFLLISFDENFTGSNTIDGTTALSGAYSDRGQRHEQFTAKQDGNNYIIDGTVQITGSKGTLTTHFTGVIPLDKVPTTPPTIGYIEGTEFVVSGTGVYAKAKGKGTFEATIDFDSGNIVGGAELEVKTTK